MSPVWSRQESDESDESDSEPVRSRVMEKHQSAPSELEEEAAEEADLTVGCNSPYRQKKLLHVLLYVQEKHGHLWGLGVAQLLFQQPFDERNNSQCVCVRSSM